MTVLQKILDALFCVVDESLTNPGLMCPMSK